MKRLAAVLASIVIVFIYYRYFNQSVPLRLLFLPLLFFFLMQPLLEQRWAIIIALTVGVLCDLHTPFIGLFAIAFVTVAVTIQWLRVSVFGSTSYRSSLATLIVASLEFYVVLVLLDVVTYGYAQFPIVLREALYSAIVILVICGTLLTIQRLSQRST